ncbi:anti-sigma B factor RsbW [Paenibacillus pinisoli]|uniref:Anti-sigma B factor RsbW n=1 Tax=Paenibacillus pinisoli TaxID=1276110 RepID=A0A3A6PCE5_9BACL|nr:ATP-binding protein [Paenibacillus pinisoli]RJX39052.1 anti-sigma B factor RsbW [Paenibacillus pinisoli]
MKAVRLQIPADADYIDLVRNNLLGVATKLGFSFEEIEDMKVAVSEACSNAVLHGAKEETGGVIDVSFEFDTAGLVIRVVNYGVPFAYSDARKAASGIQGNHPSELRVGGLGIYLMEALMDEVEMSSDEQRTEVRLMKYRG